MGGERQDRGLDKEREGKVYETGMVRERERGGGQEVSSRPVIEGHKGGLIRQTGVDGRAETETRRQGEERNPRGKRRS